MTAASRLAVVASAPAAFAATCYPAIRAALEQFKTLPGTESFQIDVGDYGPL